MNDLKYQRKALQLDQEDPLKQFRSRFSIPKETLYLCTNSLGLPALAAFSKMEEQLNRWSQLGVEGWFEGKSNWYASLDPLLKVPLSHLLGARADEVVVMNSLTINLHLLLVSFYQPDRKRFKILMDSPTFPSDLYAIKSHLHYHGLNPEEALIFLEPRVGEHLLRQEDLEKVLLTDGESIALLFLSSVNFLTGQVMEMESITSLAKSKGCIVGYDIAHAAGNIPLQLHAWGVDFAVGCSYKYLCSGPGGPGIAFVHASHHHERCPRFAGWWGNDPDTRFHMHLQPEFIPHGGAFGWQVSTPSILAITPLVASLELFEEAGMTSLRKKSELQTAFLMELLEEISSPFFEIVTPRSPHLRGGQLSLLLHEKGELYLRMLEKRGIICDFRPPNIIRVTPSPFYTTFQDIYRFASKFEKME